MAPWRIGYLCLAAVLGAGLLVVYAVNNVLPPAGMDFAIEKEQTTKKPNILFILIDTLRADRLGAYGYSRSTSPAMDRIAGESVVFERAIAAAPWTQPSVASLFSSRYPGVHKVIDHDLANRMRSGSSRKIAVFDDAFVTLAEVLQSDGYATAGFIANTILDGAFGFGQGFGHYEVRSLKEKKSGDRLSADAVGWLKARNDDRPFFIYLHYMDVHGPYRAREEFVAPFVNEVAGMTDRHTLTAEEKKALDYIAGSLPAMKAGEYGDLVQFREFWSALYDAGIREMDHHLEGLVKRLEEMKLWDDT